MCACESAENAGRDSLRLSQAGCVFGSPPSTARSSQRLVSGDSLALRPPWRSASWRLVRCECRLAASGVPCNTSCHSPAPLIFSWMLAHARHLVQVFNTARHHLAYLGGACRTPPNSNRSISCRFSFRSVALLVVNLRLLLAALFAP